MEASCWSCPTFIRPIEDIRPKEDIRPIEEPETRCVLDENDCKIIKEGIQMSELHKVASKNEVGPGQCVSVDVGGKPVAVFNVGGSYFAIGNTCTHQGAPLTDGTADSTAVTCPWHGARFDLRTGASAGPPAPTGVPTYRVVVDNDDVKIEID
jgi:nitrite reductase/ring-hydroxylating ferredoxin subunit